MTITIDLPADLETRLAADTAKLGLLLPLYAARLLAGRVSGSPMPTTGTDFVAYWREAGVIGTWPDVADSQALARQLRTEAERRGSGDPDA